MMREEFEVWTGGQEGSDIAGTRAAHAEGVATGGWMPRGFLTENGKHPEYEQLYGMRALSSPKYPERTRANIRDTDGTLLLGDRPRSRGSALTSDYCERIGRPCLHTSLADVAKEGSVERVVAWLRENGIRRLNVAGNRDAPEQLLEEWLRRVFREAKRLPTD